MPSILPSAISRTDPGPLFFRPTLLLLLTLLALLAFLTLLLLLPRPTAAELAKELPFEELAGELPGESPEEPPIDLTSSLYQELLAELREEHGFTPAELTELFAGLRLEKRVLELMDGQWEAQPYHLYAPRLLTWWNVGNGRVLLERHRELLDKIEARFGVEREIIVAIWGVESNYGSREGAFNIFSAMNTIFAAYPRRSPFYRQQLIELLLLARENGLDPRTVRGSYGGAFGQAQFIPSSFRAYAVDFDGDSRRDILHSVPDVLASIANYLRHFGWRFGGPLYAELGEELRDPRLEEARLAARSGLLPRHEIEELQGVSLPWSEEDKPLRIVGLEQADGTTRYLAAYPNFQAITYWNNSYRYAMAVIQLAEKFGAP